MMHKLLMAQSINYSRFSEGKNQKDQQKGKMEALFRGFGLKMLRGEDGKSRGNVYFRRDFLAVTSRRCCKQQESGKEVESANRTSHIAGPCPSAAGDYVDYRMIRTAPRPSGPPSLMLHWT